jgi:hypothetical protein
MQGHRHQELIHVLSTIEAEVPAGRLVDVVLDDCAAHKHPNVLKWLLRRFTPTFASWINALEGVPAKLNKRGVFQSPAACGSPSTATSQMQTRVPSAGPSTGKIIASIGRGTKR